MSKPKTKKPAKTEHESLAEIEKLLKSIEKAEEAVQVAEIELNSKKEEAKTAKGVWMTAVSDLRELVRTRNRWAQEAKRMPLLNQAEKAKQNSEAAAESNSKPWREWKVSLLADHDLPPGKVKLLEEAGIDTLGKLTDKMNRQGSGDFWWRDVKGFGEGGYYAVVNAIMGLRNARPEFQAEAVAN